MQIGISKPKVSVVVIAYNEERYIAECIKSILGQGFKDFELVIVDDCSTDRTWEIISSFRDRRIVRIRNRENYNVAKARNIGLKAAKGEFIFFKERRDKGARAAFHERDDRFKELEERVTDLSPKGGKE